MKRKKLSRRQFLGSAAVAAAFTIVPRHVLGGPGQAAPSDVVTRAVIGLGRGHGFVTNASQGRSRTLAVCDPDRNRMKRSLDRAGKGCEGYTDFRRILDRNDIDVVYVMTPPHWHALICIAACQAGLDIYCEKPMTRFIAEGRAVANAVKRYGRIFQIGTFGRFHASRDGSRVETHKVMASGLIARDKAPRIVVNQNWKIKEWSGKPYSPPEPVPKYFDYDMWLGPAPHKPYFRHRTHGSFRGYWDYDGGGLTDMGQHYLDAVQWTLAKDHTSPVRIKAHSPQPAHPDACGMWGWVEMEYSDGTMMVLDTNEWGEKWPGSRRKYPKLGDLTAEQQQTVRGMADPEPMIGDGSGQFERAVRERRQCAGNAEVSHRCACLMHLANIAIRTGREIRYDPAAEQVIGDDEANRLVNVPMRAPWHL